MSLNDREFLNKIAARIIVLKLSCFRSKSISPVAAAKHRRSVWLASIFSVLAFLFAGSFVNAQTYTYEDVSAFGEDIDDSTPCGNPLVRNISVTDSFTIVNVKFGFVAEHRSRGDIRVILEHPDGTRVTVVNSNGADSNRNYDIELDDASGNPINDGDNDDIDSPYYDRTASPSNPLSAFDGKSSNGVWKVEICDVVPADDDGKYERSRLTLEGPPVPSIGLVKSCPAPTDCITASQLPDTELTYQIDFSNTGGASAENLALVDVIPSDTDFKLTSATVNVGTTGLTFVIEYSSDYDPGDPSAATWTYTPVSGGGGADAGFDRNVLAIRWRVTSGSLSQTAPNNAGDIGFTVKIR